MDNPVIAPFSTAEEYRVQVSDLIQVSLPGENTLDKPISVNRQGSILLPEVGLIPVAGMTASEMKTKVAGHLNKVFRDLTHLQVYVYKKQLLINVSGYVNQPGEFTLEGQWVDTNGASRCRWVAHRGTTGPYTIDSRRYNVHFAHYFS